MTKHDAMLATWKCVPGLRSLRRKAEADVIVEAIRSAQRAEFRVVHYTIQSNHLHLIVEADSREAMVSGMRGLGVRLARRLNKLWRRTGGLFVDRFHEELLKSFEQVRNALRYVLNNHRKHNVAAARYRPDPYSSGNYFDGWSNYWNHLDPRSPDSPVASPNFKLGRGWKRRHALIPVEAKPGPKIAARAV